MVEGPGDVVQTASEVQSRPLIWAAFAHRNSRIMANIAAFYEGFEDRGAREVWATKFAAAIRLDEPGAYVGFLGDEGEARSRTRSPASGWCSRWGFEPRMKVDRF